MTNQMWSIIHEPSHITRDGDKRNPFGRQILTGEFILPIWSGPLRGPIDIPWIDSKSLICSV